MFNPQRDATKQNWAIDVSAAEPLEDWQAKLQQAAGHRLIIGAPWVAICINTNQLEHWWAPLPCNPENQLHVNFLTLNAQ